MHGLTTSGTKAEMYNRLLENDPTCRWMEILGTPREVDPPIAEAVSVQREVLSEDALMQKQVEVLQRENLLMERELAFAQREIEMLRINRSSASDGGQEATTLKNEKLSIKQLTELLDYFDGSDSACEDWVGKVTYLRDTHKIADEAVRVMIIQRMRGKAAEWFHSRREHLAMPIEELLGDLQKMFQSHTSKMERRVQFEERQWKRDEKFADYFHHKVILANHMKIDEDELVDYIIAGIPDPTLRDQARIHGHVAKTSLLKAFEQVSLRGRHQASVPARPFSGETKTSSGDQPRVAVTKRSPVMQRRYDRCFYCGGRNHDGATCPSKGKGRKCFQCQQFGHISVECPTKKSSVQRSNYITRTQKFKNCKIVSICGIAMPALIDTGSDISLMPYRQYKTVGSPKLIPAETRFRGVGTKENKTLGKFTTRLEIDDSLYDITVHVVSDDLIDYDLLIGNNFLDVVSINITNGRITIAKPDKTTYAVGEDRVDIPEVYKIDCIRECDEVDVSNIEQAEHRNTVRTLIKNYKPEKLQHSPVTMKLVVKDDEPIYQRPRRLSPRDREEVNRHIDQWLRDGIVQPSLSDYTSPVVLVSKKNGDTRLCIDYRKLNCKIVRDRYPLPLIDDQIDALQGANIFSTLDLKNGFFHVPLEPNSRKYTSFITPDGQYEFLYTPFGLCNSPAVFQKFINAIFRKLIDEKIVLTYMDDLVVIAMCYSSAISRLKRVLQLSADFGLNINWQKSSFLQTRIEFLVHIIENSTTRPTERKTNAVTKFPQPRNVKDVQSFLGLTGYFRKFVYNYSRIARPLSDLLKANTPFVFDEPQKFAFEQLKAILSTRPVLNLYRENADTELHTDASILGYGAILMQRDERLKWHPVYYASGKTTPAEAKYTSYELEVLAIIRALCRFRVYLLGINFKIITDCKAFTLTMRKRDLCVRVARWALFLEEFHYEIMHRSAKNMPHVDVLSRYPLPACLIINECEASLNARIAKAQHEDAELAKIIPLVAAKKYDGYVMRGRVLFKNDTDGIKLVVPRAIQMQVIRRVHDKGHFAADKTETLLKREYHFNNMRPKTEKFIQNCLDCILANKRLGKQEGWLRPTEKGNTPLDVYHIDHLGPLASTKKNFKHILVIVDGFSKFVWLYATRSTTTAEVVTILRKQSMLFGNPRKIISDRGTAFTSNDFDTYCKDEGIEHSLITTGIPRGNGQVERINRTLISVLTKLTAPKSEEWYRYLSIAQQCLNSVPNRTVGTTPFQILFGTCMRLKEIVEVRELIEKEWMVLFHENREELRENARQTIAKVQQENVRTFNKRRKTPTLYRERDLVAIKRTQVGPGSKLAAKYLGPYEVTRVLRGDRYTVRKVGDHEGPTETSTAVDFMKPWLQNYDDLAEWDSDCPAEDSC